MSKHGPDMTEPTEALPSEVAVIGIGCRFPGARCLEEFWDVLSKGENHITEVPPERWLAEDFYDSDPDAVGKTYTNKAGFIKDFAQFDHMLFGINETEASKMDVQQRQVLECTYMALENAGITRKQISGKKVGVYIGQMNSDYNIRMVGHPELSDQYTVTGTAPSVIANRVSYLFNLTGPSMSIDTACSSSIVAIHQAILGLRAGDCSLAICGGVSLLLHPHVFTNLCKAQMLSKTGQCHAFSDAADGYTRGEGCGIVILKLAEEASSDGDNIWGTMVTGLNQDGRFAQPITAPSEKQQEELLKDVFTKYNIDPGTVQYIEAHGTGTKRGDPVEIRAFSSFFSKSGQQRQRYIGSVKTNIGHLEPAAGVAGLIKVLLMMKHNTTVPSLHFDKPNELIDFDSCQFVVPTKCYPWADESKVACLNSFGFGGVFCGMGTAWTGMCRDLMETYAVFRESIYLIDKSLRMFVSWSLTERFKNSYDVNDPVFGPIAIFACQVALARLWESLGVIPEAVLGQSVGEVAAAHIAGILPLDEAVMVIYHRTDIMSQAIGGKMLMIRNIATKEVERLCDNEKGRVNIALYYSPVSCTVSGDSEAVEAIKEEIQRVSSDTPNVQLLSLNVTKAFHSSHMDPCQQKLDLALKDLKTKRPAIHMVSSVDPQYGEADLISTEYWGKHIKHPVRFHDAVVAVTKNERKIFVEIGPKPILRAHLKDIFSSDNQSISLSSMSENRKQDLFESLAVLNDNKIDIKWENLVRGHAAPSTFPRYSFNLRELWKFNALTQKDIFGSKSYPENHLFVKKLDTAFKSKLSLDPSEFSSVYEHKVKDIIVVPGATYAEAGFGLVKLLALGNPYTSVISVRFYSPVTLRKGSKTELDIDVLRKCSYETTYKISKDGRVHATGTILSSKELYGEDRIDIQSIKERCSKHVSGRHLYQILEQSGFTYGENFATIDCAFRGEGESLAALKISPKLQKEMNYTLLHPAILDAMMQSPIITYFNNDDILPVEMKEVTLRKPLQKEMFVYAKLTNVTGLQRDYFLCLLGTDGTVLAQVRKFSTDCTEKNDFDETSATYMKSWRTVSQQSYYHGQRNAAICTNLSFGGMDFPFDVVTLDMITAGKIDKFESALQYKSHICFIFEMRDISLTGDGLLEELMKRIKHLHLLLLYHSTRNLKIPIYVMMETRRSSNSKGVEAATSCLNEAINGFCRCVLKEYKNLQLKTVEIHAADRKDFVTKIPTSFNILSSKEMEHVPDIKLQDGVAQMFELQLNTAETPLYRTTPLLDVSVLCSKIQNAVVEPSFFLAKDPRHIEREDETKIQVSRAVIHSPLLYAVTAHEHPHFGTSKAQTYPILSLEFSGKVKIKSKECDIIACYPAKIQQTITVPTKCYLPKVYLPQYDSGYLLILYTLWCMGNASDLKSVAILYATDTKTLALALAILLRSKHVKSVSLVTQDETVGSKSHELLILTVMPTENTVETLCEKWTQLKSIVFLDTIMTRNTIRTLTWCPKLKVIALRPLEMFSPSVMSKTVPKMFKWIKSHFKEMKKMVPLLKNCPLKQISGFRPIKLTEILQTTDLSLCSREETGLNYMKTQNTQLIKKARSYLVVGGLTGLGWECVSYLAMKGAGCVIILNRRKANKERQTQMVHLENAHGCIVKSFQTDVTNIKMLENTFLKMSGEFVQRPLAGILFGAAVLQDSSLLELTSEKLRSSLSPKVSGAWNLHCLTAHLPLDFFVFHSSSASVLGNPGQSNYGAGNGFMDELAHCRRRCGLSGQSFNWGPLGLGMLQNKPLVTKRLQKQGFETIEKKELSQCLSHLLMLNEPQSIVMKINRRKLADHYIQNERCLDVRLRTTFEPFMKSLQVMQNTGTRKALTIETITKANKQEALHMIQLYLKTLVCERSLLEEDTFDVTAEMKLQGVDSMYAMEISGEIMSDIGVKISAQQIQLQSTLNLAHLLTDKLFSEEHDEATETDSELIVSKSSILRSIADSFSWLTTQELVMAPVIVCTVRLPDVADCASVARILKPCMALHKLTRSTCDLGNTFAIRELTVDEAFDLRVVSGSEKSAAEEIKRETITLEKQGPLRFIFINDTKHLVIICHKFFFDFRAITIFVNDILGMALGSGSSTQNTDNAEDVDIAEEIQKVLAPQFKDLREFWKSRLAHVPDNSFRQGPCFQGDKVEHIIITRKMDSDFY